MVRALPPLFVEGLGLWTPRARDWLSASALLAGAGRSDLPPLPEPAPRPSPEALPANERRRAPDAVLIALDVAQQAQRMSGRAAAELASVFTSAHGDLAIVDALCTTLASAPQALSPMRFHHSVHNAPSGYWAIAAGSHAGSNALAGYEQSFACGLLEAAALALADERAVLLAGADTEARGAMLSVNASRGLLGCALVLAPQRGAAARCQLTLEVRPGAADSSPLTSALAHSLADNALAVALPLFEALAACTAPGAPVAPGAPDTPGQPTARLTLPVGSGSHLAITLQALS
jgi:hypothetical protein